MGEETVNGHRNSTNYGEGSLVHVVSLISGCRAIEILKTTG